MSSTYVYVSECHIFSELSSDIQFSFTADDHVVGLNDIISKGLAFQWINNSDDEHPSMEDDNAVVEEKMEDKESSDELEGLEFTMTKVCSAVC